MWGEGTVLSGRYQLRQRIGGGSMGDVWRALDTVLGREVAVKILLPALLEDEGFAARFHTEARVLAALSHPGIVSVYDYGQTDDPRTAFLVMELITGRPLSDLLDDSAPLSQASTLAIVAQTLEALQVAHDRGIVHRDVKPANLMLRDGAVVVTDFGVARTADARRLTAADVVLGTAVYAAPEQARHSMVSAAADQYAVGVIAYECLAGFPPFDGDTPLGIMMKHLQEPVPPLPDTVPEPVRELVMRALAKDPAERFGSAKEMARAARRLLSRDGSLTRTGTPEDSFQTGVVVAEMEAADADADGDADTASTGPVAGAIAAGHAVLPVARADGDFMSFTVLPREAEPEDEDAEVQAASAGLDESATEEIPPAWASYAIRPPNAVEDWASFTVGEAAEETVPLPDAEGEFDGAEGLPGAAVPPVAGAEGAAHAEAAEGPHGVPGGRVVPQDSFTVGVVPEDEGQDPAGAAEPASPRRGRLRRVFGAGAPEVPAEASGDGAAGDGPVRAAGAEDLSGRAEPPAADEDAGGYGGSGRAVPQDSFMVGVEPDLAPEDSDAEPDGQAEHDSGGPGGGASGGPGSAQPNRRRTVVLTGAAAVVAAVVAVAIAYPLSGSNSSAAGAVAATRSASSSGSTDPGSVDPSSVTSLPSSTAGTSATTSKSSASSASSTPSPTIPSSSTAVVTLTTPGPPNPPGPSTKPGPSTAPRPPVSSPSPGPTAGSSPSTPIKTGYITNVGDADVIDTYHYDGLANLSDSAPLTVEAQAAGQPEETFQVTPSVIDGVTVYQFGNALSTKELIDDDGSGDGKISLYHVNNAPNQKWWLATDGRVPPGAYYLHNQQFSDCLTDNGSGQALSTKPCASGNKAQEWYLP
ncbi:protein kinase [Catenulispora sp. NL8]|uniref:non-specific serine/threonine protein kinase n=1 Tax=Catenulispora pinistramenti TaxID=2705254 RepID=A0ABS5KZF5_9ACTN|nr:serine/threonine-protein kinase [Catenulispora pinistramenti]MBS2551456.1 protein kinase [Catenulispora pinistramenti]